MVIKLKKTLYVGLGGTGAMTLLKIKKCFIDSYGEIPPMISFLAIDTDGASANKEVESNRGEKIKFKSSELLVCSVKGALNVYQTNIKTYDWVPSDNVDKLSSISGSGAGQVRSNGRFIAYYNHESVSTNISAAIHKIHELLPKDSKYVVDTNMNGVDYPAIINVISSLAGGTGSGMLIDVLSIIRDTLNKSSLSYNLYPWIILPEVFRAFNSGPSMANVLYNSYGVIRELDYIMHHNPKDPAINFGYSKISEPLFDYAYLINNTNSTGTTFSDPNELLDSVAKCAFLPSNKMGDEISSPFDNIRTIKTAGSFDILNKKAWAASASSAELVYDGQAVGRAIAYNLIYQLCNSMLQSPVDGTEDANKFFDDKDVMIRENDGRDDIINYLLSPDPSYTLMIDENTTINDIINYLSIQYNQTALESELKLNLDNKLNNTINKFNEYITEIMSRPQGKVDGALKFIDSLFLLTSVCKSEMLNEAKYFHEQNSIERQWNPALNAIKKRGIGALFGNKIDEDAVMFLQNELTNDIRSNKEEIRREWAVRFYTEFEEVLQKKKQEIEALKNTLKSIMPDVSRQLIIEQNNAQSKSKFQIFLHEEEVQKISIYAINDDIKNGFVRFLQANGKEGVASWIGQSKENIFDKLWTFVKTTDVVINAVNKDINSVLSSMKQERVIEYLAHLKILASPLWTYNTQGYNDGNLSLDKFIIIGVPNRDDSVLTNETYVSVLGVNGHKPTFATTNQNDRIYLLVIEDLLPVYAVNNYSTYSMDNDEKVARGYRMSNYIDEKLNNRINAENFNVIPKVETDDILKYWVWGFVFQLINYDNETDRYWIRSRSRGDALDKYRYNLGNQRDVAYDNFKTEGFYKEIEENLNQMIKLNGNEPIESKINEIKSEDSYKDKYAQLSPLEERNLNNPKYKAVRALITEEIGLMSF